MVDALRTIRADVSGEARPIAQRVDPADADDFKAVVSIGDARTLPRWLTASESVQR
jgi:hypothetical protein